MCIEIIKAGMLSSIQDRGRFGFAGYGVPISGVLDSYSAKFANLLLGNNVNDALMEVSLLGPKLLFHTTTWVAIAGISAEIYLNDQPIELNKAFAINKGDVLYLKRLLRARCIYLAVAGGFQTEKKLGSRSMYEGITYNWKIEKGDILPLKAFKKKKINSHSSVRFEDQIYVNESLKVFPGPEFDLLDDVAKDTLMKNTFSLSKDSNRMAFPLEEKVKNKLGNILSVPVLPGSVQLTPSGQIIILMKDCQVSGGYPRILQLSEDAMNLLGQKIAGEKVRFCYER